MFVLSAKKENKRKKLLQRTNREKLLFNCLRNSFKSEFYGNIEFCGCIEKQIALDVKKELMLFRNENVQREKRYSNTKKKRERIKKKNQKKYCNTQFNMKESLHVHAPWIEGDSTS